MRTHALIALLLGYGLAVLHAPAHAVDPAPSAPFFAELAAKVIDAEKAEKSVLPGKDGWLFFVPELRSLSMGPFWGEAAAKVSRCTTPENADPLPAILDFKAQCDAAGVELLLVPVPAKALIYPEMISTTVTATKETAPARLDVNHLAFLTLLKEKGVKVLDLVPTFLQRRFDKQGNLYCQQDTHWSGRACALTAKLIAEQVKDRPWVKSLKKRQFVTEDQNIEITGDLWQMLGDAGMAKETLPLTFVKERTADGLVSIEPDRQSPIVLLGDSHNLVFHGGGDMLAQDAGLADHLAQQIGIPVDLVGVRGSGATPARMNLARRKDNLAGKKLVIWCFTEREFTESTQGWRKVPVVRPAAK